MRTIVAFSGGKDSHLTLMRAVRDGAEISGLLYLDGGKKHFGFFNDFREPRLIGELAMRMGFKFYVQKAADFGNEASLIGRALRAASEKAGKTGAFYIGLSGPSGGNGAFPKKVRGAACVYPLLGVGPAEAFREARREGLEMLITGVVGREARGFLGKRAGDAFMSYLEEQEKKGADPDNLDFQTLVLKGPLLKGGLKVLKSRPVETAGGERHLEILEWKL